MNNSARIKAAQSRLRDMELANSQNTGERTLIQAVLVPEVAAALQDWIRAVGYQGNPILIGGLAVSHYVKPRYTSDIDLLFASDADVPTNVVGFKRTREHAFQHERTHVEIEVLDVKFLGMDPSLFRKLLSGCTRDESGFLIPSPCGLVVLKLLRFSRQDQADIEALVEFAGADVVRKEAEGFDLSHPWSTRLEEFLKDPQ